MNYANIIKYDIANGFGIRTSLFVSGCQFCCEDCFNQEARSYEYGELFTSFALAKLMNCVSDPKVDGLSILGGDPLWQDNDGLLRLTDICHRVHDLGKDVWLWSGFTWEEIFPKVQTDNLNIPLLYRQNLVQNTDVFVDGRLDKTKKDLRLRYRGSSNQRIIDVKKSLENNKVVLFMA